MGMVAAQMGLKVPKRSPSRRRLQRLSRTPSMQTIWEWAGSDQAVDAVPATGEVMANGDRTPSPRGQLWLRHTGLLPLRLFSRRPFQQRFAVLLPPNGVSGSSTPRLQLFLVRARSARPAAAARVCPTPARA